MTQDVEIGTPSMRSLRIGITAKQDDPSWLERKVREYIARVREYGAEPAILAPDAARDVGVAGGTVGPPAKPSESPFAPTTHRVGPSSRAMAILERLDGVIFSGGGDVHPRHFGQELAGADPATIDEERDLLELDLARAALAMDLPVFGICRGCQVLNVAAGGGMVQHLEGHRSPEGDSTRFHDVRFDLSERDGRLLAAVGQPALAVNSYHHQGIDVPSLAVPFVPVGMAHPDAWLVEAYESPRHTWLVAVQWHPERMFELGDAHRRIWESYFAACRAYRGRMRHGEECRGAS